jgi:gliding-associated putative ABC transporter substrate-binding component GldG
MNKKTKNIALLVIGIFILNSISQKFYQRIDLTKDNRYTLSETTLQIVDVVDQQVLIQVYLEGEFPSEFQRLQAEVRQFLEELKAENNNIIVQFINPDDQREKLIQKGMQASQLTIEEDGKLSEVIIFPWAEISYQKKTVLVNLLPSAIVKTQEEQLQNAIERLEYSFANAIHTIIEKRQKKIAILSGNGELEDVFLYSFLSELTSKYRLAKFTLDSVAANPKRTLKDLTDFDLAIIAKPTEKFSSKEKFVLDQFITNGGKSLWMIDNVQADQDSLFNSGKMMAYARDLNLTDLLFQYGIRINNTLIQDLYAAKIPLATGNVGNTPQFQNLDWFFHPLVVGNANHSITNNTLPVRLQFATQIDTLPNTIKKTPLLTSSVLTKKVGVPNFIELQSIANEPKENEYKEGRQLFGVLLEGNFNSAYAKRVKPFETNLFKAISEANKMVIISDGDIGKNQILKGKPHDLSSDKWTQEQFGNKEFLLNAVDYLLDDIGLIDLRNKSLQINILDKQKAFTERGYWQVFNIVFPILFLFGFGIVFNYIRKRKYAK